MRTPGKQLTPVELSTLEHAFASDPASDAFRPLTEAYLAAGRFMEAMVVCKKGVKAHPGRPDPRLLLALLDYESRWVHSDSVDAMHSDYPMGYLNLYYKGMFSQMVWAVNQLSIGYYGWRTGTITQLEFPDGSQLRLNPRLNAGTVALQYLFSKLHDQSQWSQMIDPSNGFLAMYRQMFGDPWQAAEEFAE